MTAGDVAGKLVAGELVAGELGVIETNGEVGGQEHSGLEGLEAERTSPATR